MKVHLRKNSEQQRTSRSWYLEQDLQCRSNPPETKRDCYFGYHCAYRRYFPILLHFFLQFFLHTVHLLTLVFLVGVRCTIMLYGIYTPQKPSKMALFNKKRR